MSPAEQPSDEHQVGITNAHATTMNTSSSIDEIINEMNNWAKAEGRYLGKAFWEIPSQLDSILELPLTPEAELRVAALRARRLERRKKAAEQSEPVAPQQDAEEQHIHT